MTKSGKHCDKMRNCWFWAISSFVTMFSKISLLQRSQKASIWGKGLNLFILHQLRNKLSAYINHDRCLLPGDSRCFCAKIPKSEPAHHGTQTLDLWYERPMLYLCTTVFHKQVLTQGHSILIPFSLTEAFWCLCKQTSFANNVAKGEIVSNFFFF